MSSVSNSGESLGIIDGENAVVVNYALSLKEMISCGGYNPVGENIIAKNFPFEGEEECKLLVARFCFSKEMMSDSIIAEMDRQGYRPARIKVLLSLGEQCSDLRCKSQVVGLGSVWHGEIGDFVPTLWRYPDKHALDLCFYTRVWSAGVQFAAVRK